ncbi:potassium channel family protein [Aquibacillus kalidii]|uniref:potassium channel family protein n=1 Tax=Aquibacillus kalidii TaxID=2762597 RepID=UPI001647DD64|nr:potassium channel family protein [Aquibacillus kalidii]
MCGSLYSFIFDKAYKKSYFSYEIFYTLLIIYFVVLVGFGLLYFLLSFSGVLLVEDGKLGEVDRLESLAHSFYFSGVTLMTVGYGDITPVGWGRLIALIEALIGYILPATFFLKIWQASTEDNIEEEDQEEKDKERDINYL